MGTAKPLRGPGRAVLVGGAWSIGVLRRYASLPLFRNAGYLWVNTISLAAFGFVFWTAAARLYPADAVGYGASAIAAMGLIAGFSNLGLGLGAIRFLPERRDSGARLINSILLVTAAVGLIASLVFLLGLDLWSPGLAVVRQNPIFAATFLISTIGLSLTGILDQVFVATRTARMVLIKNVGFNLSRLVLVVVFAAFFASFGIVAAFGLAAAAWVGLSLFWLLPLVLRDYRPAIQWAPAEILPIFRFSLGNHAGALLLMAPGSIFTLVVLNTMGPEDAAYFYVAWTIGAVISGLSTALSLSLFAEGSQQSSDLRRQVIRALVIGLPVTLVAALALLFMAEPLLSLFGSDYARNASSLLRILAIAGLPFLILNLYIAVARVRKRAGSIVWVAGTMAATSLLTGYPLSRIMGLEGIGIGWLVGLGAALVVIGLLVRDPREDKLAKE